MPCAHRNQNGVFEETIEDRRGSLCQQRSRWRESPSASRASPSASRLPAWSAAYHGIVDDEFQRSTPKGFLVALGSRNEGLRGRQLGEVLKGTIVAGIFPSALSSFALPSFGNQNDSLWREIDIIS